MDENNDRDFSRSYSYTEDLDHTLPALCSFVIPARNEEKFIRKTLRAIKYFMPQGIDYEIIVVDNGSTDSTAEIAVRENAKLVSLEPISIGAARNRGAHLASGDIIIFLDADCTLTHEWSNHASTAFSKVLGSQPNLIVGSQVVPPQSDTSLLSRHWFLPFASQMSSSHIGSAHMIWRRSDFTTLGGFDESLATGEDYDICVRLKKSNGEIINNPALVVEHHGFPNTLVQFMQRERWHGAGDVTDIRSFFGSKVAILSVIFTATILAGLISFAALNINYAIVLFTLALTFLLSSSFVKMRHAGLKTWVVASFIFVPYYLGRFLSLMDRFCNRKSISIRS